MSKGLGQKIAIKFTEDLVGNVSGKPDPILGLGWTRNEFEKSTNTTPRTNGWRFSPIQDIEVTALMIFSDVSTAVTMHLWRVPDQAKLTQITFVSKAGEWASGELPVPIRLIANVEYVVTSNTPINDGYMYSDTLTPDKRGDFSPHITMIDAYRVDSQNTFPTGRLTGPYTNSVGFAYKIEQGVGNEAAFTVTGKEYQYVNGPLIDKEYRVEKVERYPIAELWRDDFSGQMNGVEVGENGLVLHKPTMAVTDSAAYETVSGTSLQGTVEANAGDFVLATVSIRDSNPTPTPTGWTLLYETYIPYTNYDQRLAFFFRKIETSGAVTFTATQPSSNRIYLNLIAISGIEGFSAKPDMTVVRTTETGAFSVPDKSPGEPLVWGCVTPLWATSAPYENWVTTPDDLTLVSLDQAITQPRLANFIDLGDGTATGRTMQASPKSDGHYVAVAAIGLINEYSTPGTYITTTPTATLPADPRLRFEAHAPEDTMVTVEYACTDSDATPPGTWTGVEDGDLLTIDDAYLWLRYTLETEDTSKTPTLLAVWLEESEAPNDLIRLVMHPQGRFNNVEDPLTVQYDQSKGSLRGRGGPVKGFTETFTPTDLEPKPNPHVAETITIKPEIELQFLRVEYHNRFEQDTRITAKPSISIEFIDVSEINP